MAAIEELRDKGRVLVTGANGFIGNCLVARLRAVDVTVRGLVRSARKGESLAALGAEVAIGDLTDPAALRQAVADCTVIINVGAALHGTAAVQYAVNVTAVGQLAELAQAAGVQRLVHVSSIAVYGFDGPGVLSEDVPPNPGAEHYGQSKALGERRLAERAGAVGLDYSIVRPGMVYGPGSGFWTSKVFRMMQRAPLVPGDGLTLCPAVYIDDVVNLLIEAAVHPAAVDEIFNATPDPHPTWRDYLGAYARLAGHDDLRSVPLGVLRAGALLVEPFIRLTGEPQPVRGMVEGMFGRGQTYPVAKAARLLDWRPQVGLDAGIAEAARWLHEQGMLPA